jgi:hypothetical protein
VLTQGTCLDYDLNEEIQAARYIIVGIQSWACVGSGVCYWHTTREQQSMAIIDVRNPVCKEADGGQRH